MKAKTKPAVIPAQAGIQFFAPGFRVSLRSPGMTGDHERTGWGEDFVPEQRSNLCLSERLLRRRSLS